MKSCFYCKANKQSIECIWHTKHNNEMSCPNWKKARHNKLKILSKEKGV